MIAPQRTDESFLEDQATQVWTERLARAGAICPTDIDALLAAANPMAQHAAGRPIFAENAAVVPARPDVGAGRPAIGVLLHDRDARMDDAKVALLATRYAALAVEKECDVIILSHQNNAGFERFGFRVERLAGDTDAARAACLDQLRRFWGLDLVI